MKISLIQMNSGSDKAANLAQAEALITRAVAEDRADWIALPEVFDFMGGTREQKFAAAEVLPGGPAYAMAQEVARKHRVFIHAGSVLEKVPGDTRLGNTTLVFNRNGEEIARYRKIHLFDITTPDGKDYKESAAIVPGDAVVTYDCEGVTIGCAICYDIRFPNLFQALMDRGAQMIVLPAAFTLQTGKDHWEVLCRARAIETETYFCAPGQTGAFQQNGETRHTYGHSLVVDPWGLVIARASDGVGIVSARVEPKQVARVRGLIPVAHHKRVLT